MPNAVEWQAIVLSLRVSLIATAINIPLGVLVAWYLTKSKLPLRRPCRILILTPLVLPPIVTGYVLLFAFSPNQPLGSFLRSVGLDIAFNWRGAVLASWIMSFPLIVRSISIAMERHDWRLEEASRTLGVKPLKTWFCVTLPLLWPGLIAGAVLCFARGFGEFGATIVLCSNIPGSTQTLPLAIFEALQRPQGDASAMRLSIICLALSLGAVGLSELLAHRDVTRA